jgi:hypothetical protein
MKGRKPHKRQTLMSWAKAKLRKPATLRWAMSILRAVDLVARFFDWFR